LSTLPRAPGPALVAITLSVFLLPLASGVPLLDPDEGLHAAMAREMAERGDWVTPRLLGEAFLDKPILFFWAQAASIRAFGTAEWAVRLPGLLFGLAGALSTALLARVAYGAGLGALAGACYATMLLPLALSQAAVHDVVVVPCVALALAAFWKAAHADGRRAGWWWCVAAGVWLGLSVLAKGLAGVAMTGLAFGLWLLAARRVRLWLVPGGLLALAVATAVAAPWYVAMERANAGYFHYYFVERHLLGFATSTQIHGDRAWWYYLPVVVAGSLPWGLYLPGRLGRRSGGGSVANRAGDTLAWVWLVGGTAFLSLAGSKMVTYVWPVFPAAALLASRAWAGPAPAPWARWLHAAVGVALVPAVALGAVWRFDAGMGGLGWATTALLAVAWLVAGPHRGAAPVPAVVRAAGLTAASCLVALFFVVPPVASTLSARALAQYLNEGARMPARLWVFDERIGSLLFYLDDRHRAGLTPERVENVGLDRLLAMRRPPDDTLVAVPLDKRTRLSARIDLASAGPVRVGHYEVYTARALHDAIARTLGAGR
jgi:4-amino-4-deoxy-L-arabinose transferase-like glycosyltransferase